MPNYLRPIVLIVLAYILSSPISVYGFDDFTYDQIAYDNPSADVSRLFGGTVIPVRWYLVEALELNGPSVGIGLDPTTDKAYINGKAFSSYSLAVNGPDAGIYECGHLYKRMLINDSCSSFVHIPTHLSAWDLFVISSAIAQTHWCAINSS